MFDLVIRGGWIVDGAGNPPLRADLGISGDRIGAVGRLADAAAGITIEAAGLVVAPGFIDVHSHSDLTALQAPDCEGKVRQGVTTEIVGQDGLSYAPLEADGITFVRSYFGMIQGEGPLDWDTSSIGGYLDRVHKKVAVNIGCLVPHGSVRLNIMGLDPSPADVETARRMRNLIEHGLTDGALGMSTGLTYVPACYSSTQELIQLCEPLAATGRPYVVHGRRHGDTVLDPLLESLEIGRRAGVPVQISHLKAPRRHGAGRAGEMLALLEKGRDEGIDLAFDSYPYALGASALHNLLPPEFSRARPEHLLKMLAPGKDRERLRQMISSDWLYAWDGVIVASVSPRNERLVGKSIAEAASDDGKTPLDLACELLVDEELRVGILIVDTLEEDMECFLVHPLQMVGSDGIMIGRNPHPRAYGAFARVLGVYVRERRLLSLVDAVRRMTSHPAQRFGLSDRGLLRAGMKADAVVFDQFAVRDTATVANGRSMAEGVSTVIVNGVPVLLDGQLTGALPGQALRAS